MLNSELFLVHLCVHLYKEATTTMYVIENNDLNLIKFCDVREYVLQKMNEKSIDRAIEFSLKNELGKCLYYCFYYLKMIYNDGYENKILEKIGEFHDDFLNEYGEDEYNSPQIYRKTFWERFFSVDNSDEITIRSNYIRARAEIYKSE